jgi:pyrrolidone-carboxylate peptidase
VFYGLMHLATAGPRRFRAGFLHVPRMTQQAQSGAPAMALEDITRGIVIVLETAAA